MAVLSDSKNVKNKGWTAGMAIHRQVSEHVWLGLNADFSLWRTETNQVDQVAWIPNELSSDPAFVVDLAEARMPTIGGNFTIQYRFLPSEV